MYAIPDDKVYLLEYLLSGEFVSLTREEVYKGFIAEQVAEKLCVNKDPRHSFLIRKVADYVIIGSYMRSFTIFFNPTYTEHELQYLVFKSKEYLEVTEYRILTEVDLNLLEQLFEWYTACELILPSSSGTFKIAKEVLEHIVRTFGLIEDFK